MHSELEKVRLALLAKDLAEMKSQCRKMFGCYDSELDELTHALTEFGFFNLCQILDQIRRAPVKERAALVFGVPLVLTTDELPQEKKALLTFEWVVDQRDDAAFSVGERGQNVGRMHPCFPIS